MTIMDVKCEVPTYIREYTSMNEEQSELTDDRSKDIKLWKQHRDNTDKTVSMKTDELHTQQSTDSPSLSLLLSLSLTTQIYCRS